MRLGQLILFTGDVARLAAFYRDVLGLGVLEDEPGWCVLDAGGVKLALHGIPKEYAGEVSDPPQRREDSYFKPTFVVDDLDAMLARLAAHGVAMSAPKTYGPRTYSDGIDPDGNVFQIAKHA
ncbi:MAG TPA: VOC family protein [Kofleriaceae bacterium]|jgi:predicted enzyme related to lactoylglutathione lyase|nr:VOC family protein [Kofleriaceae bacterium]